MTILQPPKPRHSFQSVDNVVRLSIPSRKNWFVICILSVWFVLWLSIATFVGSSLVLSIFLAFTNSPTAQSPMIGGLLGALLCTVWVAGWTISGLLSAKLLFWQLGGVEYIQIDVHAIRIRRAIFGRGRSRQFLAEHVKDLRVSPTLFSFDNTWLWWLPSFALLWHSLGGTLAFDYGAKTFRFAEGVDEAEAKQILHKILTRFPQYGAPK
jgi:hypothetical protein